MQFPLLVLDLVDVNQTDHSKTWFQFSVSVVCLKLCTFFKCKDTLSDAVL